MRKIAYAISLALSFMIPWEGVIRTAGLGNGTKILGFVLAAFWLATVLVTGQFRKPSPFHLIFAFFVIWNTLSVFWSARPNATAGFVSTWAQLLILSLIWWDLYTTRAAIMAGLQAFILGTYVSIGSAIANFFSGAAFYSHYDRYSPGETNPDGFGFIMALGIPVAWYLAASPMPNRLNAWLRPLNYLYIPAAFIGIAMSGTRTALIASVPGMLFGLASMTRVRMSTRIALFAFVTALVLFLLPFAQEQRSFQRLGTTTTELTQGTLNERTIIWGDGFAAFAKHPLLGVASGMYPSINRLGKAAHNTFLSVLVEVGIIGFIPFALLLIMAGLQAWKHPKWEARFWLTTLFVWSLGASTLSWGHRKPTWLILNLLIASAGLAAQYHETARLAAHQEPETQDAPPIGRAAWPRGAKEKPHLV